MTQEENNDNNNKDQGIRAKIKSFVDEVTPDEGATIEEKISHNAKIILLALFTLVGFIVLLGTIVIYAKLEISVEVLTIVFSTAITGCFTLGGVLINAIWGK